MDLSKFWVVAVLSNPVRYDTRVNLFKRFQKYIERHGINLCVVELAYGDRPFSVADGIEEPRCIIPGDHNPTTRAIRLRTFDEMWHKENMINIGISRLPNDWEYVAWIDADCEFKDESWAVETWQALQHHYVVQMFAKAIDFGPDEEVLQVHNGFMWSYWDGGCRPPEGAGYSGYYGNYSKKGAFWHPGYAWAARREAIDYLGGLMEFPVLGSADHHMATSLIGVGERSIHNGVTEAYREQVMLWQERATKYLHKDVGYVNTTLFHNWHGKKADRKYVERWAILTENEYNPMTDIKRDSQGVLQLVVESERQRRMRDQIRMYFRQRNEDSIDVEHVTKNLKW